METTAGFTDLGVLPSALDDGIAARAAIGLLVLATDQTMEHEFRHLIRLPGVAVYGARLFNDADITPETLRAWVRNPQILKLGCYMPDMQLTDEEMDQLVRYLLTLN